MAKTFLELIEQVKGILGVANGGTGLSTSGSDPAKALMSDGAGGFIMGAPSSGSFPGDGGTPSSSYVGVAKIDLGGPS